MINIVRAYPIHQQTLGLKRSQGVCEVIGWLLLQVWSNEHRDRSLESASTALAHDSGASRRIWLESTASSSLPE